MSQLRMAAALFCAQSQFKLQKMMQYRGDFTLGMLVTFGFAALGPLTQILLFSQTNGYPGWTWPQILLFQGVLLLVSGLRGVFLGDLRTQITQLMEKGDFDRLLLRPFPPLLFLLTGGFTPYAVGTLLVGAGAVAWAWPHSGAALTPGALLVFVVMLAAGMAFFLATAILFNTLTLRWVNPGRLSEITDKVLRFGDFPIEIYPLLLRTVFVTVLPFSVATYWPAQALLGRVSPAAWVAAVGAVGLCWAMTKFWQWQLARYTSAGG